MDAYEGGRVSEKLIEEGAMVKKGDIILKLENMNLYEQILASESNLALKQNDLRSTRLTFDARQVEGRRSLATASTDLQRLKRNYEQNEALFADELISKEVYLTSKENYELAQKQYDIVKLQTEQDDELRKTSLAGLRYRFNSNEENPRHGLPTIRPPKRSRSCRWAARFFRC